MKKAKKRESTVRGYETLLKVGSAIVLIACGALLALAAFARFGGADLAGPAGASAFGFAYLLVGIGAFLLPIGMIWLGLYAGFKRPALAPLSATGAALILVAVLAFAGLFSTTAGGAAGTLL